MTTHKTWKERREELFTDDFKNKQDNPDKVVEFCADLKKETTIQTGNDLGMTYEYLPNVVRSVEKEEEK